jgi:NAD(P)-dependent dehydrogenase (short-subunit alcohol dehydrogenase family)
MTKSLARALAPHVCVNAVAPGPNESFRALAAIWDRASQTVRTLP